MTRVLVGVVALVALVAGVVLVTRNRPPEPTSDSTPSTDPAEIIEARRVLMRQMAQLMAPIDAFVIDGTGERAALQSAAATIEAMMLAFPHLFPPATNLYDAALREPPTTALPAIWTEPAAFATFSHTAEQAAAAVAASPDAKALQDAGRALRASCDGCHARFVKAYTPPQVTPEDLDVDFDSVFQK